MAQPGGGIGAALFLAAPSPGQIVRFLQRRQRTAPFSNASSAMTFLLSDPSGPAHLRALTPADRTADSAAAIRTFLETAGADLSVALEVRVTLLWTDASDGHWGGIVCEAGETLEDAEFFDTFTPGPPNFLARLTRPKAITPLQTWARERRLPLDRLPQIRHSSLPVVDYETVAKLDQKSLLVENTPRLYRFSL